MTTTTSADRAAALKIIRELAPAGHALVYIAQALNRAGIPTPSGRREWHHPMVKRLAEAEGITVGYGRRAYGAA